MMKKRNKESKMNQNNKGYNKKEQKDMLEKGYK